MCKPRYIVEKAYKNISYLFGAILLLIVLGFFKTYFGLFPHFGGLPLLAHFHAIMILSWFGLLIVQPLLIRYKKLTFTGYWEKHPM